MFLFSGITEPSEAIHLKDLKAFLGRHRQHRKLSLPKENFDESRDTDFSSGAPTKWSKISDKPV